MSAVASESTHHRREKAFRKDGKCRARSRASLSAMPGMSAVPPASSTWLQISANFKMKGEKSTEVLVSKYRKEPKYRKQPKYQNMPGFCSFSEILRKCVRRILAFSGSLTRFLQIIRVERENAEKWRDPRKNRRRYSRYFDTLRLS